VCRDWGHLAIWGIWQSEHDFRDKHASQFTTRRFVLLPNDLVTGAAKARIVIRPTRTGPGSPLETIEAPAQSGLFSACLQLGPVLGV
jgi:hypothetical protein